MYRSHSVHAPAPLPSTRPVGVRTAMISQRPTPLTRAAATPVLVDTDRDAPAAATEGEERFLLAALRSGDEAAFVALVARYQSLLIHLALLYVADTAVAEEVVQETWMGVLQGLARFEARSSLRTWIVRILTNRAKTRGEREGRTAPFSVLDEADPESAGPAEGPGRFRMSEPWRGHGTACPCAWDDLPEAHVLAQETRATIWAAIAALAPRPRAVITLRDIEGWSAAEVCHTLGLSETNQRMLLSRARARVRQALAQDIANEYRQM